jgi:hypothetical protein
VRYNPEPPGIKQFSPIDYGSIMNHETEKNESRAESVANSPTKRSWHAPEIEEVDLAETQNSGTHAFDGSTQS